MCVGTAKGHQVFDESGKAYVDFFAGAGALNYGHNHAAMKQAVMAYIQDDGIVQSLDMNSWAKQEFLEVFESRALSRLRDRYKVMFTGPTGTDAVEAAVRLAKKVTGRLKIASLRGGFHGMTAGALALSPEGRFEQNMFESFAKNTVVLPFDTGMCEQPEYASAVNTIMNKTGEAPAALVYETIQGEGGIRLAATESLRKLESICQQRGILTILDDIQMGCGRTGPFFSSESHGLRPDIIVLSKSIGGFGVPLSLVLIKPELDIWEPGEHSGTFRGQDLAFVAGKAALEHFWATPELEEATHRKGEIVSQHIEGLKREMPEQVCDVRGRGLIHGIELTSAKLAADTIKTAFERGLLMERAGRDKRVLKISPPLTVTDDGLEEGMAILEDALRHAVGRS